VKPKGAIPGILGGGQLARMLCEAAGALGLRVGILAGQKNDPAAQICEGPLTFGRLNDPHILREFFGQVGPIAIESEFVNCDVIAAAGGTDSVLPPLACIRVLQNKLQQKLLLESIGVPTSRLIRRPKDTELRSWISSVLAENVGHGVVLKWAEMGYDGKGTLIQGEAAIQDGKVAPAFTAKAFEFCKAAEQAGIEVYAEEKIPFVHEVAMVAVRNAAGDFDAYPLVYSEQVQGICKWVKGPAVALGAKPELEALARSYLKKIGDAVGVVGAYAVEFFVTADDRLLVNEIAPRVHNTGHYTQNAAATSQFENHWRALLGMPFGPTTCSPYFAMVNLLGPAGVTCADGEDKRPQVSSEQVAFHWYHKAELRPGRKLGHLNTRATSVSQLNEQITLLDAIDRTWCDRLIRNS